MIQGAWKLELYIGKGLTSTSCTLRLLYLSLHVNLPRVIKYKNSPLQPTFKAKDTCRNQVVSDPALRTAIVVVSGCWVVVKTRLQLHICSCLAAAPDTEPGPGRHQHHAPCHRQSGVNHYLKSRYWQEI